LLCERHARQGDLEEGSMMNAKQVRMAGLERPFSIPENQAAKPWGDDRIQLPERGFNQSGASTQHTSHTGKVAEVGGTGDGVMLNTC